MGVSAGTRMYLSHRFFIPVGADSWSDWKQWNFASRTVFGGYPSTNRNGRLLPRSNAILVERLRCLSQSLGCWWRSPVLDLNRGFLSSIYLSRFVDVLFVACDSRASFSEFPMGCAALRGGLSGNLLRAVADT